MSALHRPGVRELLMKYPTLTALRGFALGRSGLARFITDLGLLFSCRRMAAGLKHQGDPDCQKDHDDDGHERAKCYSASGRRGKMIPLAPQSRRGPPRPPSTMPR